jgi:hypothetical protein
MDVELALKINRLIHNECKDVPHDIGFRIVKLIDKQKAAISDTRCCEELKDDLQFERKSSARVFNNQTGMWEFI